MPQLLLSLGAVMEDRPHVRNLLLGACWVTVGAWVLWADYLAAFDVAFPVTYIVPVVLAANAGHRLMAIALSALMPFARFELTHWGALLSSQDPLANCVIQSFVLALLAIAVHRHAAELKTVRNLLRICGSCRRVRVNQQFWQPLDVYMSAEHETRFSEGLCPDCRTTHAPVRPKRAPANARIELR